MNIPARFATFLLLSALTSKVAISCTATKSMDSATPSLIPSISPEKSPTANACSVSKPVWAKPPDDSAVSNPPEYGYYFINEDRSIWASAWWAGEEAFYLRASEEGIKVGWFRPAGAALEITGKRLDGQAPPLDTHIPCCYPTQFQATGLYFPTEGCWEVTAKAADSELSFVVWVEP
jgi:hypothetical protein